MSRRKLLTQFIEDIPDEKLVNLSDYAKTLYTDNNFRLDMQGKTSDGKWNLQIQVNKKPSKSSLKSFAPNTVAGPVLSTPSMTAAEIRQGFNNNRSF